jgi:nucleoside-diphosphate-sugar epimerase
MRIFLTGATGFIGTHIIPELHQAGHTVLGLTRSEEGAQSLKAAGVEPHYGNIEDLDSLRSGAEKTDGIIHCGFNHDFSKMVQNCENDRLAIEAMGEVLIGSDRPLVVTSGVGLGSPAPGQLGSEDFFNAANPHPRKASEIGVAGLVDRGVNVSVVRLPQVHDPVKQGLISYIIPLYRQKGVCAYVGEGASRFAAAHVLDVAHLYRLVVEKFAPGARYNAVAEEGVPMRDIAEALARGLNIPAVSITPEEAPAHFGWMAMFANMDIAASSTLTRQRLGWKPTGPTLLEDLAAMDYSKA